jgi:hypothetical protein
MSFFAFLVSFLALGAHAAPQARSAPGKYIVALKPEAASDLALHARWVSDVHARGVRRRGDVEGGLERTFEFAGFAGYAGSFDEETLEEIRANVNVSICLDEGERGADEVVIGDGCGGGWGCSSCCGVDEPGESALGTVGHFACEPAFVGF